MRLSKKIKKEIEEFVGENSFIDIERFNDYMIVRSHDLILDITQAGHTKRKKLKHQMRNYCKKLCSKNRVVK